MVRRASVGWIALVVAGCSGLNPEFDASRPGTSGTTNAADDLQTTRADESTSRDATGVDATGSASMALTEDGPVEPTCPEPAGERVVVDVQPGPGGFMLDTCGQTLDVFGRIDVTRAGILFHAQGGCDEGRTVALGFSPVGPALQDGSSTCARLEAEFDPRTTGCALAWFRLSDDNALPFYETGRSVGRTASGIDVELSLLESCDCTEDPPRTCCAPSPGNYALVFSNEQTMVQLVPGESASIESGGPNFEVYNGVSHVTTTCDDQKQISFYIRELP